MKKTFEIKGMTCSACVSHVEKAVKKLPVQDASVSLMQNSMTVVYDPATVSDAQIIAAVEHAGYGAALQLENVAPKDELKKESTAAKRRLWGSVALLVPLMYLSMQHMGGWPLPIYLHHNPFIFALLQLALTLPILYLNRNYFQSGIPSLLHGAPNMDTLVAIGSGAAMLYGFFAIYKIASGDLSYRQDLYFESAAMILTLVTVGKYLERHSRSRTGSSIEKLMDLAPKTASVIRDGQEEKIPSSEIRIGDIVLIRPGEKIPADGVVVEGGGSVDESALTGESMPVYKADGDKVSTGAINGSGSFQFRAERTGGDTTLAAMIRLVEEAASSRAPIARLADKVAAVFVPIVMGIALISVVVWLIVGQSFEFAMSIGIAVLVISCPCALGLATPVAIMVGTGKGAEQGILVKSAEALETLHKVNTVVLDKTGTLTVGRPEVTDVLPSGDRAELVSLAVSLEKNSEHPLASAVLKLSNEFLPLSDFTSVPGKGVQAMLDETLCAAGNAALMQDLGVNLAPVSESAKALAQEGKTILYIAKGGILIGLIACADTLKPTSKAALIAFAKMDIRTVMLTGDNAVTAQAIRNQLGMSEVYAGVLPGDKARIVQELRAQGKVAMIGDGVNDAPALATADVGLAIGAGTDIAMEAADIVLMHSDLTDAVTAVELSRAVIRNIKQNLFWAFFYNCVGIPLAAGVFYSALGWKLSPMIGAAAMSLSSIFVVSNALRLRRFKPRYRINQEILEKGVIAMKKTIYILGMSCANCSNHVAQALNAIDGVTATVDHAAGTAALTLEKPVSDSVLTSAVESAGYQVQRIQ